MCTTGKKIRKTWQSISQISYLDWLIRQASMCCAKSCCPYSLITKIRYCPMQPSAEDKVIKKTLVAKLSYLIKKLIWSFFQVFHSCCCISSSLGKANFNTFLAKIFICLTYLYQEFRLNSGFSAKVHNIDTLFLMVNTASLFFSGICFLSLTLRVVSIYYLIH